jgi:pyruvate/2-oxoglutarate/acetoin dehydrogenase E1 component
MPVLTTRLPSTPHDVKGLFKTSLRDPGPVLFIEHKSLYNSKGTVPEGEYLIPFGEANILREGSDITIVAMSKMVGVATRAAEALAHEGISAEVIDPRTIVPLDRAAITKSIKKTGRLAVVDESPSICSFAAELMAIAVEDCFRDLQAAPVRICSVSVPNPFSPVLENQMLPSPERVADEVRRLLNK